MSLPEVSFAVTVYNKRRYLPLLVASIRAQRGLSENCDYIFVDDGSTDGSFELLQELTAGWPNVTLVQKENGGQTSALNAALSHATKPYVKLWDADDYAHPDLTAKLIAACQTFKTELAFCPIDGSSFDTPDDPAAILADLDLMEIGPAQLMPDHVRTVFKNPVTNPTGLLVTRRLLDAIGPVDPRITIPDIYLAYAAALLTPFAQLESFYAFAFVDVPGRLTANEAQILHDINGALYCVYENFNARLSLRLKRYIGKRMTGRAWKWAKRHNGAGPLSGDFARFVYSCIDPLPLPLKTLYWTLLPFRQNRQIRTGL